MTEAKPNLIIRFRKWMVIAIAIGAMLYLGGAVATDIGRVGDSLENFDWAILIPVCALTLLNYFLRFVKWHYLLRRLVDMPLGKGMELHVRLGDGHLSREGRRAPQTLRFAR